jgi:hypothetical protein
MKEEVLEQVGRNASVAAASSCARRPSDVSFSFAGLGSRPAELGFYVAYYTSIYVDWFRVSSQVSMVIMCRHCACIIACMRSRDPVLSALILFLYTCVDAP